MVFPQHKHGVGIFGKLRQQGQRRTGFINSNRCGTGSIYRNGFYIGSNGRPGLQQATFDGIFQAFDIIERVLPKPGTGPSEETRDKGHYRVETYTSTSRGARYRTTMAQQGDPGYKATSVLLGECGLALAFDQEHPEELWCGRRDTLVGFRTCAR